MSETEGSVNEVETTPNENESLSIENAGVETRVKPKSKVIAWIAGGVVLVGLLAVAAFVGGRLLNNQQANNGVGPVVMRQGSGGEMRESIQVSGPEDFEYPEEVPATNPDAAGPIVKREDNIITIGTGMFTTEVRVGADGVPEVKNDYDGPEVEIVVNRDTKIYRDSTMDDLDNLPKSGEKIKVTIEDATVDDIPSTAHLVIWGRKSGDRILADVIMFTTPGMMMKKPN